MPIYEQYYHTHTHPNPWTCAVMGMGMGVGTQCRALVSSGVLPHTGKYNSCTLVTGRGPRLEKDIHLECGPITIGVGCL